MPPPYTVALVGCGRIGLSYAEDPLTQQYFRYITHGDALKAHPAFALSAAIDPDPSRRQAALAFGFERAFASVAEMTAAMTPDILVLATPPEQRLELVTQTDGVKAIVCEKPLAGTMAEAAALVALCEKRGIPLFVNFWRRFDSELTALAAGKLTEQIGEIQHGFALYGNGLRNNGGHLIDLIAMLARPVAGVRGVVETAAGRQNPGFALQLAAGGCIQVGALDFTHYREIYLDLWGTKGRWVLSQESLYTALHPVTAHRALTDNREIASDRSQTGTTGAGTALWNLYANVAATLAGQAVPLCDGVTALEVERLLSEIETAGRQYAA